MSRIRLGDVGAPAPGVALRAGPPVGAPFAADVVPPAGAAAGSTLVLRRAATAGFAAVAVTWAAQRRTAEVSVAVRVRRVAGSRGAGWTGWRTAGTAEPGRDAPGPGARSRDAAELQWWGPAAGLEIAFTAVRGAAPRDVAVDLIDPGVRPGEAAPAPAAPAPGGPSPGFSGAEGAAAAGPAVLPARVPMPPIYRRATWGADERKATWGPRYRPWIKAVAVHHTATTNSYSAGQVPAILRSILHFHAVSRGWGDIGYNVLVDRFGRVWEGRRGGLSTAVVGAHTGGFNSNTTGVAFIGDHRGTSVPRRAVEAAARYAAWKFSLAPAADPRGSTRLTGGGSSSRHPAGTTVTVPRIFPHGLTNRTSCPGARGLAVLPLLRQRVAALLGPWLNPAALRARLTVWRPSDATWRLRGTAAPLLRGAAGDVPAPADYDGDGRTDLATWRPDTGGWVIRYSASRTLRRLTWGNVAHVPVPADTDGNGRAEPLVFSRTSGNWYNAAAPTVNWGAVFGDVPLPADYDGDGREDLAVWRPSTGDWHIRGVGRFRLGDPSDVPVPADYDGDGDVEPAIWSPGSHRFTVRGQQSRQFGVDGDVPVPGQYDGDAPAELAVWRVVAGVGRFVVDGVGQYPFGTVGDQPIPAS